MLKLSKKIDYGLIVLKELCGSDGSGTQAFSSREMALGNSLPAPMVANILKALCNAGLVTSMRGAQGGYHLSRAAHRITL
ncbi:MAG: Rrf2 family transcriptional regulator, partial [Deltaproteobacteria bacterium]|nr:Rrf2 family transcriptional regulator [Deltaproteobacteria bacterium]